VGILGLFFKCVIKGLTRWLDGERERDSSFSSKRPKKKKVKKIKKTKKPHLVDHGSLQDKDELRLVQRLFFLRASMPAFYQLNQELLKGKIKMIN